MANRPIFVPKFKQYPYVEVLDVEFTWYSGFAKSQAQKSIDSLHEAAAQAGYTPVLEISSKSREPLGITLSAFNLLLTHDGRQMSVECAFQGSKVFEQGGPFTELYEIPSRNAKRDDRLKESGNLVGFNFLGQAFRTQPVTSFYDWLYLLALSQNQDLASHLQEYQAFSDIAFNPERSWNCQARSAALYVALEQRGVLAAAITDIEAYYQIVAPSDSTAKGNETDVPGQLSLF